MSPLRTIPLPYVPSTEWTGRFSILNADGTQTLVTSLAQAADLFGKGSTLFGVAQRCFPLERIEQATASVHPDVLGYQRSLPRWRVGAAFGVVAECLSLVDAHARSLFETDLEARFGCARVALQHWRGIAFRSLALLFTRSPELLPIGPDVHADCHGGDP